MENITHNKEKGQPIETASEMTQMLKLVENDMNTIIRTYSIGSRRQRWDQALNTVHTHQGELLEMKLQYVKWKIHWMGLTADELLQERLVTLKAGQ